jgi:hypothetical protein
MFIYSLSACPGISNKRGISLIAVIIVMLVVATLAFVVSSVMSTGNMASILDMQAQQAFYIAEAGLKHVIFKLKDDSDYRASPAAVAEDFGDGSFSVTVTKSGSTFTLTSTGSVGNTARVIEQIVLIEGGMPEAFDYAIICFGSSVNFRKSTGTVNGDIASAKSVQSYNDMTINGTITERSDVADPSPVDMANYEYMADNIETGGFTFQEGNTYGSAGNEEIWYIQGIATIERDVTIYGSVIAEGTISMGVDSISIDAASGYPAIISGNNINGNGLTDSTISGLIFADNKAYLDDLDNVIITGTILAGTNIAMTNGTNFTIDYDPDITSNPPPYFYGHGLNVTSQSWDEVY